MKKQLITLAALAGGFALGASALVALADATWTAAPATPPNSNVSAPVNVGAAFQTKNGNLQINGVLGVVGNLIIATGPNIAKGSVLTAGDSLGTATWSSLPHGLQAYITPGTYSWTAPVGVTSIHVRAWGGGGGGGHSGGNCSTCGGGTDYGGGGGGYVENVLPVTPGTSYTITVGNGGASGVSVNSNYGSNGGNTTISPSGSASILTANGGRAATFNVSGAGGSGSSVNTPLIMQGGTGAGTAGGYSPQGGQGGGGGGILSTSPDSGQMPGGGGESSDGSGASGMLSISY